MNRKTPTAEMGMACRSRQIFLSIPTRWGLRRQCAAPCRSPLDSLRATRTRFAGS